jgi:glycosyltransferase involved in cell wall biosynthesis
MADHRPLLAVVIPTRNRSQYVTSAIKSLSNIADAEIEIVVEDNSDTDALRHWIHENVCDERIVYNYSSDKTSQSGNYDRSMRGVSAEYVAFIGDDDGVNPEIVRAVRWAKKLGLDALTPSSTVNYSWPDLEMKASGAVKSGQLVIRPFTGVVTAPDPYAELLKCVRDLGQSFHKLPKAYYGIVRREVLNLVQKTTGSYFPGISPDMAGASSLALYVKAQRYVDYPLFAPGSSKKSLAGVSGLGAHVGALREQGHLPPESERNWSPFIPAFFSVETIWAEALISALKANRRADIIHQGNFAKYYADCLAAHPEFYSKILRQYPHALHAARRGVAQSLLPFAARFGRQTLAKLKRAMLKGRFETKPSNWYSADNFSNIEEAVDGFALALRNSGKSFDKTVEGL